MRQSRQPSVRAASLRARSVLRTGSVLLALTTTLVIAPMVFGPTGPVQAASFETIAGPTGSGLFGEYAVVLANGNFVVVDSSYDAPGGVLDVGAVYLYDGSTHQVISTLTGQTTGDAVGACGVRAVGDGTDFVVLSPEWSNPATHVARVGAATWVNGDLGSEPFVSAANSLIGTAVGDRVGCSIEVLSNGNYVVESSQIDLLGFPDVGAATWANGAGGTAGVISSANSFTGKFPGDGDALQVTALTNGNYAITLPSWNREDPVTHAVTLDVGAAAWGNGSTAGPRLTGIATTANTLYGTMPNDNIGREGVLPLSNGNYVVRSARWDLPGKPNVGAATLLDGAGGGIGAVSASNSIHGDTADDLISTSAVALDNGNFVLASQFWDKPLTATPAALNAGAVTWRSGDDSAVAQGALVSTTNSLHGSSASQVLGQFPVTALVGGAYVVTDPNFTVGSGPSAVASAGAVTYGKAAGGIVGPVTPLNSFIGAHPNDRVGDRLRPLANGGYVIASAFWDDGATRDAGAVTWSPPGQGLIGTPSASNSLIGTHENDNVGYEVETLANGDYVVRSEAWNGGRGAATWSSGTNGLTGPVTEANSLVGNVADDRVGQRITALGGSRYVVGSNNWHNGGLANAGAATFSGGPTGITGHVTTANSFVANQTGDELGDYTVVMSDGAYLVLSRRSFGTTAGAGSVTYAPPTGRIGTYQPDNTLFGTENGESNQFQIAEEYTADGSILVGRQRVNAVVLIHPDRTPPTFPSPPSDIAVPVPPGTASAIVTYPTPVAVAEIGTPSVTCDPPSGSTFPLGVTTVTCTAVNTDGLTSTVTFDVIVGGDYLPLAPARLADTRPKGETVDGQFAGIGQVGADSTLALHVAGRGGVPSDSSAVALNVTVTEAAASGFLTAFPCGEPRPEASNLNYTNGSTIPNAVLTKLGANGDVCLYSQQAVHLVVDANGAFPPSTSYRASNPARVIDTRAGRPTIDGVAAGGGIAAPGSVTEVQIGGRAGVPGDAVAVALNVTITEPEAPGYATVYPCGTEPPTASNLNYVAGQTIPNLVIAKLGAGGKVCVYTQSRAHLIADVLGHFPSGTTYSALVPGRLLDTRGGSSTVDGLGAGAGNVALGTVTTVHVLGRASVPNAASTAVLNVTVTEPDADGYVTVYPCGIDPPLASNLNFVAGQTVANAALVQIGNGGDVCLFNSQRTHLVVDVAGYFP